MIASGWAVRVLLSISICSLCCPCSTLEVRALRRNFDIDEHVSLNLDPSKVAWLHIAKTGTSWINTLATWGCPQMPNDSSLPDSTPGEGRDELGWLNGLIDHGQCKPDLNISGFLRRHAPLGVLDRHELQDHAGNWVTMLRQPEQRIISGFHHGKHDYPGNDVNMTVYAPAVAGCQVRMMLGKPCGPGNSHRYEGYSLVREEDVDHAIRVVEEEFAFVGITEEWALSVCLFHKMFGGSCHQREFLNVRPGESHSSDEYETDILEGFIDEADGKLYAKALQIFSSNLHSFGVSRESCTSICSAFPDPFLNSLQVSTSMAEISSEGRIALEGNF